MDTYWYLATPYSRFPGGHEAANALACENANILLKAGIPIFSPIAHSHALTEHGLTAVDHDFWINTVDRPLMRGAHGLIFLQADGWQDSKGMHEEIVEFTKAGKRIVFMEPGKVPGFFRGGWEAEQKAQKALKATYDGLVGTGHQPIVDHRLMLMNGPFKDTVWAPIAEQLQAA